MIYDQHILALYESTTFWYQFKIRNFLVSFSVKVTKTELSAKSFSNNSISIGLCSCVWSCESSIECACVKFGTNISVDIQINTSKCILNGFNILIVILILLLIESPYFFHDIEILFTDSVVTSNTKSRLFKLFMASWICSTPFFFRYTLIIR